MRYICLLALMLPPLSAQDGAAIYKERCAACHDAPKGRIPALSAIKAMSGEAIYAALTTGLMKTQAEGLSTGRALRTDRLHCAHRRLSCASRLHPHMQRRRRLPAGRRPAMEWVEHEPHQLPFPGRGLGRAFSRRRSQTQAQMGVQSGRRHHGAIAANNRRRARVHRLPDRRRLFARRRYRLHPLGISGRRRSPRGRRHRRGEGHVRGLLQRWRRNHVCAQCADRRVDLEGEARWITTPLSPPRRRVSTKAWSTSRTPLLKRHLQAIPNTSAARFAAAWSRSMPPPARRSGRRSPFPKPQRPRPRLRPEPQQLGPSGAAHLVDSDDRRAARRSVRRNGRQLLRSDNQHQRRDPRHGSKDRRVALVQTTHRK